MVTSKKTARIIVPPALSREVPPPASVREGSEITGTIFRSRRQQAHETPPQTTAAQVAGQVAARVAGKKSLPMSSGSEAVAPAGRAPMASRTGTAPEAPVRTTSESPGTERPCRKQPDRKQPATATYPDGESNGTTAAGKETVSPKGCIRATTAHPGGESNGETVSAPGAGTAPGPKDRPDNRLEALCGSLAIACVLFALVWGFALSNAIIG